MEHNEESTQITCQLSGRFFFVWTRSIVCVCSDDFDQHPPLTNHRTDHLSDFIRTGKSGKRFVLMVYQVLDDQVRGSYLCVERVSFGSSFCSASPQLTT
jgi:hypothetical protein